MKKTEKIEVRVSFEEKERLTELAEQRNQNISELIRDRMAGNYTLPAQSLSRDVMWNRGISVVALVLGSIAFLWTLMGLMGGGTDSFSQTQVAEVGVSYNHPDYTKDSRPFKTSLLVEEGYRRTYEFKTNGTEYRLTLSAESGGQDILRYDLQLCRISGEACDELQTPGFDLGLRQPVSQFRGVLSAAGPDGETIEVGIGLPAFRAEVQSESERAS